MAIIKPLELSPHQLIHDADIGLDNPNNLSGDVLVNIIWYRNSREAIADKGDGGVDGLEEAECVYAAEDEAAFIEGFGTFGAGADADGWERVADRGEETGLFREGAAIAYYCEGVHLKTVVVVEAEGLVLDYSAVQLEA